MRIDQPGKENSSEQGSEVEQALAPSFTKPITADAVFETTQVTSSDIAVSKAEAASNLSNPILSIDYPKDGILMTAQDIVTAYRLFLRRQPENDAVIASRVGLPREKILLHFLCAKEFIKYSDNISLLVNTAKNIELTQTLPQPNQPSSPVSGRHMLFVCGTPRSGTTAMHKLLTSDPRIVLGMERYGGCLDEQFGQHLFTKERFFDFEVDSRDHHKNQVYYDETVKLRFEAATYIGDKIPLLYKSFDLVRRVFPDAKFVVLLRNIVDICNSYQNRKNNPQDNWDHSIFDAIDHWNQLLEFTQARLTDPRIKVIVYEDFYANLGLYKNLYQFLGLEFQENLEQEYLKIQEKSVWIEERRKSSLTDQQKLIIFKRANIKLYQAILARMEPEIREVSPNGKEGLEVKANKRPLELSQEDIISAFRILLGKTEMTEGELAPWIDLNGNEMLARVFALKEFQLNLFNKKIVTAIANQIKFQNN